MFRTRPTSHVPVAVSRTSTIESDASPYKARASSYMTSSCHKSIYFKNLPMTGLPDNVDDLGRVSGSLDRVLGSMLVGKIDNARPSSRRLSDMQSKKKCDESVSAKKQGPKRHVASHLALSVWLLGPILIETRTSTMDRVRRRVKRCDSASMIFTRYVLSYSVLSDG